MVYLSSSPHLDPSVVEQSCSVNEVTAEAEELNKIDHFRTSMDKIFLLSILIAGLNVRMILTQPGPKCESNKAWFGNPTSKKTLPDFCTGSNQYVLKGDFNGDGRMDIMCHHPTKTGNIWIYNGANNGFSVVSFRRDSWCWHAGASLHIGDFDGDSRDDILCHDGNGNVWIAYAADKFKLATEWHGNMGFCKCDGCSVFVGDFNGDMKSDLLCHDGKGGKKWIVYATAKGNFQGANIWYIPMGWCFGRSQKLYVGDFNGDHRSDMLCYDYGTGYTFTVFANCGGYFTGIGHGLTNMGWCTAKGCSLSVARVSKDQRDDLVCHCKSPSTEALRVRFPAIDDGFETSRQWRGVKPWCNKPTDVLVVGSLQPGHCASMVCIDKVTGQYSIA